MKVIVLFAFVALAAAEIEYYKTGNDHLDMDALIADRMQLHAYLDCFNDRTPCSPLLASYKNNIPEAVETACMRCNPNQKYLFWRFLTAIRKLMPQDYWTFRQHYDPQNKYFDALEAEVSKYVKPDMEV